ncbi:hypothetical protein M8J75_000721 [Diaphorina citri]|nr:hypothetical protein M8J75_000721 [Diaphorina citri]
MIEIVQANHTVRVYGDRVTVPTENHYVHAITRLELKCWNQIELHLFVEKLLTAFMSIVNFLKIVIITIIANVALLIDDNNQSYKQGKKSRDEINEEE